MTRSPGWIPSLRIIPELISKTAAAGRPEDMVASDSGTARSARETTRPPPVYEKHIQGHKSVLHPHGAFGLAVVQKEHAGKLRQLATEHQSLPLLSWGFGDLHLKVVAAAVRQFQGQRLHIETLQYALRPSARR